MAEAKQPEISQELLREIHRVAKIGTWEANSDEQLIWSDETLDLFGVERSRFRGSIDQFYELVHPEDVHGVRLVADFSESRKADFKSKYRIVRPDGQILHIRQTAIVLRDQYGNPKGFSGVVQDVTEQVRKEAELRQAQKMETIGRLSGGVAHDFNNLLAVIMGNLELSFDYEDQLQKNELITEAINATVRGRDLVKNLLSSSGQADLRPERLNLNKILSQNALWTSRVFPKNIEIETSLQEDLFDTVLDVSATEAALINLLLNARDAMPNGGKLTVKTSNVHLGKEALENMESLADPGQFLLLAVSDTGCGIPPDKHDKIFEPFYTSKTVGQGTGLGLSMVHGFVQQSKGAMQVVSQPELGTTFCLYFSAVESLTTKPSPIEINLPAKKGTGLKILLAEDNESLAVTLKSILQSEGYEVIHAKTGDEALSIFERLGEIDVLVSDVIMPGKLQGPALASFIKSRAPSTPCLLLSGYGQQAMPEGEDCSKWDISIAKPVSRADLLSAIDQLLSPQ